MPAGFLSKYAPGHSQEQIAAISVTEYYGVTRINARNAWYVVGSDTLEADGPRTGAAAQRGGEHGNFSRITMAGVSCTSTTR